MTATFNDLKFNEHRHRSGGIHARHTFDNGYSVSVIRSQYSYGGESGKYELAVLHNDNLIYDTPVTDDVLGWLDEDDVSEAMAKVQALPPRE